MKERKVKEMMIEKLNPKNLNRKQIILASSILAVLIVGGVTTGVVIKQQADLKIAAEKQLEAQKKEKANAYHKRLSQATLAVVKVTESKNSSDLDTATKLVGQLKKSDQTSLVARLDQVKASMSAAAQTASASTPSENTASSATTEAAVSSTPDSNSGTYVSGNIETPAAGNSTASSPASPPAYTPAPPASSPAPTPPAYTPAPPASNNTGGWSAANSGNIDVGTVNQQAAADEADGGMGNAYWDQFK